MYEETLFSNLSLSNNTRNLKTYGHKSRSKKHKSHLLFSINPYKPLNHIASRLISMHVCLVWHGCAVDICLNSFDLRKSSREISDSRSDSEISDSGSLLARMRRHSRLLQTMYLRIDGRQKNADLLPNSSDNCWDNQCREICLGLFCMKWTIGNIHIWVLSQVDESSKYLKIILDLHQ